MQQRLSIQFSQYPDFPWKLLAYFFPGALTKWKWDWASNRGTHAPAELAGLWSLRARLGPSESLGEWELCPTI